MKDRNMLTLREKRHLDKTLICKYNLMYHFLFKEQTYKNKQKERIRVSTCLRNRTTLLFDILHSSFFVYGRKPLLFDAQNPEISGFLSCACV